jgi:acetoacetyl-CoA reductase/3-oxoacyl-[acyl-carrier protein] reductase
MTAIAAFAELLSLRSRTALVSGGSGGIGTAVVARLLQAGAQVVSLDRPGAPVPAGAEGIAVDLGDAAATRALAGRLAVRVPAIDIFVHCAGITRDGVLWKLSDEDWEQVLRTNLDSAFWLLRALAPGLRARQRGAVVLVSSINGERGRFGQANYAASKAGLLGLARTAARELGRSGVRVNALCPGLIRTAMTAALAPDRLAAAQAETALERLGEPDDVACAVLFLCSDLARHVTGQVLRVDGGQLTA